MSKRRVAKAAVPGQYRVVYAPDDGQWSAEVRGRPNGVLCITWGRSLSDVRKRVRGALATALDDERAANAAELLEEYRLEGARELAGLRARREQVEASVRALANDTREVARRLHEEGYSLRDIAELVGTSHQRVQQWVAG